MMDDPLVCIVIVFHEAVAVAASTGRSGALPTSSPPLLTKASAKLYAGHVPGSSPC